MSTRKLEKKYFIKGEVRLLTGLMVGSTNSALEIGGTDKQIVRHPVTKIPYIPGSSLKGKMRSLLELSMGQISSDGINFGPTHNPEHIAAELFGHIKHKSNGNKVQRPSRLIVRDGMLTAGSQKTLNKTELPYSEIKAENSIDRITAAANPRFFERVPQGAAFDLNIVLNVFDKETDPQGDEYLSYIYKAFALVQDDYLGGGGSRGNGQVQFVISSIKEKSYPSNKEIDIEIPKEFKSA